MVKLAIMFTLLVLTFFSHFDHEYFIRNAVISPKKMLSRFPFDHIMVVLILWDKVQ